MSDREAAVLEMLSQGKGTQTFLGSNGTVKERIQRFRSGMDPVAGSCGGVGGGWGNSPDPIPESCGGSGGGWGNSPD